MNSTYKREFKTYYFTYLLMGIIFVVYVLMTSAGGSANYRVLIAFGAKVNSLISAGQYWRLITCIFLHIGFTHLLFNMYALLVLGKFSERIFGHGKFLLIFFLSGLTGSIASYLFSPNISAGASGAVFGLLGAIVAYGWHSKSFWKSGLITNLLVVLAINLFLGMASSGVDNFGHLGGLLGGIILGTLIRVAQR